MESMGRLTTDRVLVTGGAGFIGSHLVKNLTSSGIKTFVIDIKVDPRSYFAQEKLQRKCRFEILDIRHKDLVGKFLVENSINYIFHLAAEPIVQEVFSNPYPAFETNIMGTINILEGARKLSSLKAIIFASSDKAYGKSEKPYKEDSPLRGDHPYDVSKSAADLISQAYFKTYGLPLVIARFGNVYGEGDFHFGRIVPDICEAIIKNKTLMLRSDGTYIRDYLYVEDVVSGYLFLIENFQKLKGEAFNFSSEDTFSVMDLIGKAEKILGMKVKYKILDIAKNEIPYQHLNNAKIRKLGWENRYRLTDTLQRVLNWYRDLLK